MASAQPPPPKIKIIDQVQRDGVLKEQVRTEREAGVVWDKKWGVMEDFERVLLEEASKEGLTKEDVQKYRKTKPGKKSLEVEGWTFVPSEKIPPTSSAMVGWRSSRLECSLERFGPLYESPRFTIRHPDRPPTPPQRFIILG